MATCETKKIDSNVVGLRYCEEECLGQLPEPTKQKWQELEPNSYSDFGGELSTASRTPISASRQNKKGVVTDISVSGGFNIDFTQNNLTDLLQGLFYADSRKKAMLPVTATTANGFTVAKDGVKVKANDIVLATGFTTTAFNKSYVVTGSTATAINVVGVTQTAEKGNIQVVGHKFGQGALQFTVTGKTYALTANGKNLTELGLVAGEWIFVGGDTAESKFDNVQPFYGRVNTVSANTITFDDCTLNSGLATDTGAGKQIELYVGMVIKNESTSDRIKRRSYTFERTLGKDLASNQDQAEYISGAVLGEFSLAVSEGEMVNADLTFTATNSEYRKGTLLSAGKLLPAHGEGGINTVYDVRSIRLSLVDDKSSVSTPLFAYVTELTLDVNNNLSENKAIGVFGAMDISAGNFEVSGKTTAYFTTIEATQAVREYKDAGLHAIFAKEQAGFIFDVPLIGLGGGQNNVEKDEPITIELEANGAENKHGYTAMYVNFAYLPKTAM